jgi:hypothetical protein
MMSSQSMLPSIPRPASGRLGFCRRIYGLFVEQPPRSISDKLIKIKYRPSIIVRLTQKVLWNIIDGDHDREIVGYIEEIEDHKENRTSQEHIYMYRRCYIGICFMSRESSFNFCVWLF